jgi:3-isopropylmalate/(R)-2-methylmalate dehydratase large subunit
MGCTITEKILAQHAGLAKVEPGQLIEAKVDLVLGNDITAPIAIQEFRRVGAKRVFDPTKVVLVPDHFAPNKDIASAENCRLLQDFAQEQNLTYYFSIGDMGIEHALLPEKGLVVPGDLIVGADSHTCTYGALGAFATGVGSTEVAAAMITGETWFKVPETIKFVYRGKLGKWVGAKDLILFTIGDIGVDGALYKAMEFTGEVIDELSMAGRLTMANMAIEAGGKSGIVRPDETTIAYVKERTKRQCVTFASDDDACYSEIREYDVSRIEPQVAFPHLPENTRAISEVGEVPIDQAVIGQEIYRQAMRERLFEVFLDARAVISTPTCGPCLGGHMGVLARGERAIATTNRNFVGRMGHRESEVYLASPAVAAASAVLGRIGSPEEFD